MKSERGGSRAGNREPALAERHEDSYRQDAKMPDPATCPACHATYRKDAGPGPAPRPPPRATNARRAGASRTISPAGT
jgi:hypothetical protein